MKTQTDLWVCEDCRQNYHYGMALSLPDTWDIEAVTKFYDEYGFDKVTDNTWDANGRFSGEGYRTFSKASCDICQSHLAGRRYRFALTEDE